VLFWVTAYIEALDLHVYNVCLVCVLLQQAGMIVGTCSAYWPLCVLQSIA
jgi:hypothetical protein